MKKVLFFFFLFVEKVGIEQFYKFDECSKNDYAVLYVN